MISILEPIYRKGQQLSEPLFEPLVLADNSRAAWREVRILVDFYRRGDHLKVDKTGIFSPKFGLKTKVPAATFLQFAETNRDADVCIINAFPTIPYYSFNVWMQGEANHPGLCEVAQSLLDACGIPFDLSATPRQTDAVLCYSNFWAGSPAFWEGYVGGVLNRITSYIEANPEAPVAHAVMGETWHTESAPFLPFIVERLFSTYLSFNPVKVVAFPIGNPEAYCMNDYEREVLEYMRPRIEKADAEGFTEELKSLQGVMCRLLVRYARAYFAANAHPHHKA